MAKRQNISTPTLRRTSALVTEWSQNWGHSAKLSCSEKAGVGGSTPSLATTSSKNLADSHLAFPVRFQSAYFSARSGSVPAYDDGEELKIELPLAQSAFSPLLSAAWLKIAVSIAPAAAMRSSLTLCV